MGLYIPAQPSCEQTLHSVAGSHIYIYKLHDTGLKYLYYIQSKSKEIAKNETKL